MRGGGSALPRSVGAGVPRCTPHPFPGASRSCSAGLSHPARVCAGKGRAVPPRLFLPSSFADPIDRAVPGPIDSVLRQPRRLSRERERERSPGAGTRCGAAADALPAATDEEEPG